MGSHPTAARISVAALAVGLLGAVGAMLLTIAPAAEDPAATSNRPAREKDGKIVPLFGIWVDCALRQETATTSLSLELGLEDVTEKEVYQAIDWLQKRQRRIENRLAKKHLQDGTLLLYDVSSSYYTGRKPELVQFGHNRDRKRGFPQIIYGLLCNAHRYSRMSRLRRMRYAPTRIWPRSSVHSGR